MKVTSDSQLGVCELEAWRGCGCRKLMNSDGDVDNSRRNREDWPDAFDASSLLIVGPGVIYPLRVMIPSRFLGFHYLVHMLESHASAQKNIYI
jgi:hypothetical protein